MKYYSVFGFAALLALANATPLPSSPITTEITFNGAAGASYTLTVPLNGHTIYTDNALSISTITANIDVESQCTLDTINFTPTLVEGPPGTWAVGPPQTVLSITCFPTYYKRTPTPQIPTIDIQFNGANPTQGAFYQLIVPLDGTLIYTDNALSISTIYSTYKDFTDVCEFTFVNGNAGLSNIKPDTWAVGPPQTITAVSCSV